MIADIANSEFYKYRAIECLHENKLKEAIIFIALAIFYKGEKSATKKRKVNPNTVRTVPNVAGRVPGGASSLPDSNPSIFVRESEPSETEDSKGNESDRD